MDIQESRWLARNAIADARAELKQWDKEAKLQRRNIGYVPDSVKSSRLKAKAAVIEAEKALFVLDVAHMGEACAVALWKQNAQYTRNDETLYKPWLTDK
jgi:hypothetical protein